MELYSIGLIDRVARQRASLGSVVSVERSRELLQTLESNIEQDEGNFDKFLSILDRNQTMKDVCEKMRVTRGTLAISYSLSIQMKLHIIDLAIYIVRVE